MKATVVSAALAAASAMVGIGRHAGYNVASALLAVLSALFSYRSSGVSKRRHLGASTFTSQPFRSTRP